MILNSEIKRFSREIIIEDAAHFVRSLITLDDKKKLLLVAGFTKTFLG